MTFTEPTRCQLCGNTDRRDLRLSLVRFKDAAPGMQYTHITRCQDENGCRDRVALIGETWPLEERVA